MNFIFDIYGTLVDIHTDESSVEFWQDVEKLFHGEGVALSAQALKKTYVEGVDRLKTAETIEPNIGEVFADMFKLGGVQPTQEQVAKVANEFRLCSIRKLRLFPHVADTLKELRQAGAKLYILSNAQRLFTYPELERLGLVPMMDGIELSSDFGYCKPSPDFFEHIIKKYHLKKNESVYVGNDWFADVQGAVSVGLDVVYIRTEQSSKAKEEGLTKYKILDGNYETWKELLVRLNRAKKTAAMNTAVEKVN